MAVRCAISMQRIRVQRSVRWRLRHIVSHGFLPLSEHKAAPIKIQVHPYG
jgi:hypothetical protein